MPSLKEWISRQSPAPRHRPWPRVIVEEEDWRMAAIQLADGRWSMLGFWGERDCVHAALLDPIDNFAAIATYACADGRFPSLAQHHAPAIRLERAIRDLFQLTPVDAPDGRPWLDHGAWPHQPNESARHYPFLEAEGDGLHQIPVGPVHAGIIEPGHFRFTANGETVVRLEERLGYTHKGIEALMVGQRTDSAARIAARVSGDSTAAYGLAFALAVEAACGQAAAPRAQRLRALIAEMERIANHFGDVGAICNDASFAIMQAHCAILREIILRTAETCFGHRLMMDVIVPGGLSRDLAPTGFDAIRAMLKAIDARLPALISLYDSTPSLQDRTVATGVLGADLVRRYGAGGFVGRASGRSFDARRDLAYAPYDGLKFDIPTGHAGDVNARLWIRLREVEQSLAIIRQILADLPDGPIAGQLALEDGTTREGVALVEGFRGDVLVWIRLDGAGKIERCHPRDPSWFQWPLLEAAIEGNIVADFPLCNKSFNCSYSGHDL
jgi:Ni,Fe-hydrogenase III large subunit